MEIRKKTLCITADRSIFLQTEKHTSRGKATGSGGNGKQPSENPHHNNNFRQNSGQNRQRLKAGGTQSGALRVASKVQNSGRVVSHSAAPRGNGSGGEKGSVGQGSGGKGGANNVARQSSSKRAVTIPADGIASKNSGRTIWKEPKQKKLFIDLCLQEVNNGGRSRGTLKPTSWSRIIEELDKQTGKIFTQKQLRSSWDYMKKQYGEWSKLLSVTGHDFNTSTNIFNWPAKRWEDYLKTHPNARQFHNKPLQFADEMAALFPCILATGSTSCSSHREGMSEDGSPFQPVEGLSRIATELDMQTSSTQFTLPPSTSINTENEIDQIVRSKRRKREKNDVIQSDIHAILKTLKNDVELGPTIEECNNSLNEMSQLTKTNPLHIVALAAFCEKKEYRQMWMNIKDEEVRVAWLRTIQIRLGL